jgi:D-3-phosphoglycerate dehydrogenase / 2-oxoglutarate reductase
MKIVVAEKISADGMKALAAETGWTVITPDQYTTNPDQHLHDADALIVRSAVKADKAMIAKAPQLKVIGRAGVGVDNVDVEAATSRGVVVMNTPGANAVAVAEHTIGLMIALARMTPRADETTRAGKWEKKSLQGTQLFRKTLGIVGLGRIGVEVAARAAAMGMRVVAFDPFVSQQTAHALGVELTSLDGLYAASDYITLHVGLNEQTTGMINRESIAKMKRGVRIVNCARGELVREDELAEALNSGQVGGAAVDVFTVEPPKNTPLLSAKNLIATPHIGGSTDEAQAAVGTQIAAQVREFLKSGVAQNAVNLPSLSDKEFAQLSPYLQLTERLGALLARLLSANLEEVGLRFAGEIAEWKTALLRSAALKGVLSGMAESVNLINAESVAQERGLRVWAREDEAAPRQASSEVEIVLRSRAGEISARGAVVHGKFPRVIEINGIEIEAPIEGNLLLLTNRDLPGVIGRVGSLLGDHGINIARFTLGRPTAVAKVTGAGGEQAQSVNPRTAIAIVQTDTPVTEPVLKALRSTEEIVSALTVSYAD